MPHRLLGKDKSDVDMCCCTPNLKVFACIILLTCVDTAFQISRAPAYPRYLYFIDGRRAALSVAARPTLFLLIEHGTLGDVNCGKGRRAGYGPEEFGGR